MNQDVLIVPVVFFSIILPIIIWLVVRHRERITMIEKGLSSEEIKAIFSRNPIKFTLDRLSSLKWGILFVLSGLAIMLGVFLHQKYYVDEGIIFGMVTLFVGVGLILFYSIAIKKQD
jgi:hypothetical protein